MRIVTALSAGLAGLLFVLASAVSGAPQGPEIGSATPDLVLSDTEGKQVKLADLRATQGDAADKKAGQVVVVAFWSFKCPSGSRCMQKMADLAAWCKDKGAVFLAVDSYGETTEQVKSYREKNGITYPIYMDESQETAGALGATKVTTSYVIDRQGKFAYVGGFDSGEPAGAADRQAFAQDAAQQVLAGEAVKNPVTTPKG